MNGISIASASRCVVCICAREAARPLSGPREGGKSATKRTSSGRHVGSVLAEINISDGCSFRSNSNWICQSGLPRNWSVALSLPMRRDSPPASKTALMFMRHFRLSFRAKRGTSHTLMDHTRSLACCELRRWGPSLALRMTAGGNWAQLTVC